MVRSIPEPLFKVMFAKDFIFLCWFLGPMFKVTFFKRFVAGKARSVWSRQVFTTTPVGYAGTARQGCKHTLKDRPGGSTTGVLRQGSDTTPQPNHTNDLFRYRKKCTRFAPHLLWGTRTQPAENASMTRPAGPEGQPQKCSKYLLRKVISIFCYQPAGS